MTYSKNTLNNLAMKNLRKEKVYQAIITDLALTGNISKEDAELLLGYSIPDYLKLPNGESHLYSEKESK